jgi:DNA-binding NarL/FixJ family response regulator
MALKVLIADDHQLTLEGVRRALESCDDIEVVGTTTSGTQVLPLVERTLPDLLVMDIRMPGLDGLTCLELIRRKDPDLKVVILSAYNDREQVQAALARGANAYVVKSINPRDLPGVLRQAAEENVFHAIGAVDRLEQHHAPGADLTERERTMLAALSRGLSNKAISKEFWVTEQTVKFHLGNIYRKLGVENRTAAVHYAHQHGLVETHF